jgi:phosphate uptake regulator
VVLDFFRGRRGGSAIEEVEETIVQMLRDGRDVYDAATTAVFGGGKSKETKREVRGTDRKINANEREVRRLLMTHSAVTGDVDLPLVLAYMSVVKDVERVGDYSKNLYDLAKLGADFSVAPDGDDLKQYRDAVGQLIADAADVFEARDVERARRLVAKADGFLDEYDDLVIAQARSDAAATEAVPRALFFRFLKRITAHVMNLMTSLILPVDQLDYYDEAKEDRDEPPSS